VTLKELEPLLPLMADLGWHLQLWIDARYLPELLPALGHVNVPVVVDHMGRMEHHHGTNHPGFQALLRGERKDAYGRNCLALIGWVPRRQTMQKPGHSTTRLLPPISIILFGALIGHIRAQRAQYRMRLVY
jgi:Amidohydrolase